MANIIREFNPQLGHLTNLVEAGGLYFYVDTCYIDWRSKYETTVIFCDDTRTSCHVNWDDMDVGRKFYDTEQEAKEGHYKVISELESYITAFLAFQIDVKKNEIEDLKEEISHLAKQLELFYPSKEA